MPAPAIPLNWKIEPIAAANLADWEKQWDVLARSLAFPTVFNLHGFALSWWQAYGNDCHAHVWRLEDEHGQTRLIAPFAAWRTAPEDWFLIGHGAADYEALLVRADDKQAVQTFQAWMRHEQPWSRLQVSHVETSQQTDWLPTIDRQARRWGNALRLALSAYPLGYRLQEEQHPYFTCADFKELAQKTLSRDYRKHENWFSKRGALRFESLRTQDTINAAVEALFALHIKKWESKQAPSGLTQEAERTFLRALVHNLSTQSALRLDLLYWNEAIVAAHFGFEWENRLYWYVTTYDPDVASHSPGKLLLANVIRQAENDRLTEVDLLRGQEAYKFQYASHVRKTTRITFYRSRLALLRGWLAQQRPALTPREST